MFTVCHRYRVFFAFAVAFVFLSGCAHRVSIIPTGGTSSVLRPQVAWTGSVGHTEFTIPTASSGAQAITAGSDGNMWFVETSANKIGRITMSGAITEFPVPALASQPQGITRGGAGAAVWFTEYAGNAIGKITPTGAITQYRIPTASSRPVGITVGSDGNIWFTESATNKVGKMTPAGAFTEYRLPRAGSQPWGITDGTDHNVWFANQGASYIGKITISTGAITSVPISGQARFLAPQGDNIWFTDVKNAEVGSVTTSGAAGPNYKLPAGSQPAFIVNGPFGGMWFTDYGLRSVDVAGLVSNGNPSAESQWGGNPNGVAAGPDGNIWITETTTNKIGVTLPFPTGVVYVNVTDVYPAQADPFPNFFAAYVDSLPNPQSVPGLNNVTDAYLAIDSGGYFYTCCGDGHTIHTYLPTAYGNPSPWHTLSGSKTTLAYPGPIAIGNNVLYVSDNGHVDAFPKTANGNVSPTRVIQSPGSIAADGRDQLYVDGSASIKVFASNANGGAAALRTISGSKTGLNNSVLSGVDRNGRIYACSTAANGDVLFLQFPSAAAGNTAPIRTWDTGYNPASEEAGSDGYVSASYYCLTDRNGLSFFVWQTYSYVLHWANSDAHAYNAAGTYVGDFGKMMYSTSAYGTVAVRTP